MSRGSPVETGRPATALTSPCDASSRRSPPRAPRARSETDDGARTRRRLARGSRVGYRPPVEREVASEVEELGYGALWYSEAHNSKESLSHGALLLAATRRLVVASGIANIWVRDPMAMVAGSNALAEAYPGRFVLGLGVSHPPQVAPRGHSYGKPVATMRAYLEAMNASEYTGPRPAGARSAPARRASAGDARARSDDGRRCASVPRSRGAHPAGAGDPGSRQAARDRAVRPAGGRPGRGPQARPRGARVVSDAAELHRQPPLARLFARRISQTAAATRSSTHW